MDILDALEILATERSPTHDQAESTRIIAQPAGHVLVDLTTRRQNQVTMSLQTLKPGEWLNDEIVTGALRLIKEVSKDKVVIIDSCALQGQERCPRADFRNAKILLPMLIRRNHWVLGVYDDDARLLVYDSLPCQTTKEDISGRAHRFFSEILGKDDIDLHITITSPLLQVNSYDCRVLVIVAAFYEAMNLQIKPLDIDPSSVDTQSAKLPQLPTKAELSEHSEAVNILHDLISSFRQQIRTSEGATKAGLENSVTRFQQRLLFERRIMGQLIGPSITNFRNGTVETQQINKPSDMGRSSGKLNGDQDNRKRKRNGLSSLTSSISPNNHDDPENHPPIRPASPA
ncbi:hypothetical protein V8F33_014185 [Rhypophila sp. PSN 637]